MWSVVSRLALVGLGVASAARQGTTGEPSMPTDVARVENMAFSPPAERKAVPQCVSCHILSSSLLFLFLPLAATSSRRHKPAAPRECTPHAVTLHALGGCAYAPARRAPPAGFQSILKLQPLARDLPCSALHKMTASAAGCRTASTRASWVGGVRAYVCARASLAALAASADSFARTFFSRHVCLASREPSARGIIPCPPSPLAILLAVHSSSEVHHLEPVVNFRITHEVQ